MLKRAILLVAGPLVAVLVTVVTALLLSADLPDPVATHWAAGGEPDGHMPLPLFLAAVLAAELVAWGALLWQARSRRAGGLRLTVAPYAWATIFFVAALTLITLAANAEAADWRAADEVGLPSVAIALAVAAVAGLAGWALERGRPVGAVAAGGAAPGGGAAVAPPAPGERVVWSRSLVSRPAAAGAVVLLVAFVVAGLLSGGATGWVLIAAGPLAALATAAVSEIVVTVDGRGLTVAFGPLGWPRKRVALERIAASEAVTVDPLAYGGWGYRKVPRRPGATAIVLRGGEALRVVRDDGRELFVTVDDAATAAALLDRLRSGAGRA